MMMMNLACRYHKYVWEGYHGPHEERLVDRGMSWIIVAILVVWVSLQHGRIRLERYKANQYQDEYSRILNNWNDLRYRIVALDPVLFFYLEISEENITVHTEEPLVDMVEVIVGVDADNWDLIEPEDLVAAVRVAVLAESAAGVVDIRRRVLDGREKFERSIISWASGETPARCSEDCGEPDGEGSAEGLSRTGEQA